MFDFIGWLLFGIVIGVGVGIVLGSMFWVWIFMTGFQKGKWTMNDNDE